MKISTNKNHVEPYENKNTNKLCNETTAPNTMDEEQDQYSKFTDWVYKTASSINIDIWKMFFKDAGEDDDFLEKDLYSIFLRIDELNEEGIKDALNNTSKYIENKLKKNIESIKIDFSTVDATTFEEKIYEVAENIASEVVEIIRDSYNSLETILMGVGLFKLGKQCFDIDAVMKEFSESVDKIYEKLELRLMETLKNEKQNFIDSYFAFSGFSLD